MGRDFFEDSQPGRAGSRVPWICILARDAAPMDQAVCGWMKWISVGVSRAVLACRVAEASLDHAVLERVEGDDGQATAGREQQER